MYWGNRWRDVGLFVAYILFDVALVRLNLFVDVRERELIVCLFFPLFQVFLLTYLVRFRSNPFKALFSKKSRKDSTPSAEAQSGKMQGEQGEKGQGYSAAPAPAAATA